MNNISSKNYTYTPSFQAYYKSSYGKRLEKSILSGNVTDDIINDFSQVLASKMNNKNKMGTGGWGTVYRIDDYYVFKTYHDYKPEIGAARLNHDTRFDKLKTYWGKVLTRIGNIEIIRNATKNRYDILQMAKFIDDGSVAYDKSLREFLTLPQKAFDNIAEDFKSLNEIFSGHQFYRFDTNNPNNFVKVGKSIKIVDDIDITPCSDANDIHALLRVFIQTGGDISKKKEIFKRCILACEKHELPLDSAHKYLREYMDKLFANAGVKVSYDEYYQFIKNLRATCPDINTRLQNVEEYLGSIL